MIAHLLVDTFARFSASIRLPARTAAVVDLMPGAAAAILHDKGMLSVTSNTPEVAVKAVEPHRFRTSNFAPRGCLPKPNFSVDTRSAAAYCALVLDIALQINTCYT